MCEKSLFVTIHVSHFHEHPAATRDGLQLNVASQQHTHTTHAHTQTKANKNLQGEAHSGALINLPKKHFENTFLGDFPLVDEGVFFAFFFYYSTSNVHVYAIVKTEPLSVMLSITVVFSTGEL